MKIKRITLYNIGPYVEENNFDFSVSKDKNIVLIGGKNGAGKTTFFKAIKTCLYGCKVWGFDSPGKEYYSIVNSLVNFKMLYNSSAKAYIEIELIFDDGKQSNTYILHREWTKVKMTLSEFFHIKKNGELILGSEEDDFVNYLLSVIPPDMFNFYFFDGESIAEFFLGAEGNKNFRNAFLKLYGLDTLSIMVENFGRNIKKTSSKENSYEVFNAARLEAEIQELKYQELLEKIKETEDRIDFMQMKLHSLQSNYAKEGGIGISDWKELNTLIIREENERDNINRWLKDVANNYLPFILLEKQLSTLLIVLNDEQECQRRELVFETFKNEGFINEIEHYLQANNISSINALSFVDFLQSQFVQSDEKPIFDFSINQINRILSQIQEKQEFDRVSIKQAISLLSASLRKSKKLRDKMFASSIDGYEAFMEEKDIIENEISQMTISLERLRQESEIQKNACEIANNNFAKAKDTYELILKNRSINDMAERAVATYSLLEEKLIIRQAKMLQQEFVTCFSSIINKENFIDGIIIDKNINVIPYKFVKVQRNQLVNYMKLNKDFLDMFNDVKYIMEMNRLEFGEVEYILLPSPIKAPFSQGERQVYIMSIYLALLKTSHKDIPFFIDTPFARIDSNHRANIVNEFFNKIKNQLFVLSTDEEIVGEYKKMMDAKISDIYTLQISDYGRTSVIAGKYFGGSL